MLDVGAGDGWFARELTASWPAPIVATCWDSGYGEGEAHDDGLLRVREQPSGTFDLVVMLDVAEHVADDRAFMQSIVSRNLAKASTGGRLLFGVPAWPWLWTSHDMRLRHERRYTPTAARSLLHQANLDVLESGGLFPTLLPIRALQMARERLLSQAVPGLEGQPTGLAARAVDALLTFDGLLARNASRHGLNLPGLSWWALCAR